MSLLEQAWRATAEHLLPAGCLPEERLEARRLFYLGAHSLANLQAAAAQLSAADNEQCAAQLRVELLTFAGTVGTELEGKV